MMGKSMVICMLNVTSPILRHGTTRMTSSFLVVCYTMNIQEKYLEPLTRLGGHCGGHSSPASLVCHSSPATLVFHCSPDTLALTLWETNLQTPVLVNESTNTEVILMISGVMPNYMSISLNTSQPLVIWIQFHWWYSSIPLSQTTHSNFSKSTSVSSTTDLSMFVCPKDV